MNKQTNKAWKNFQKLQIGVIDKCWGAKCKTSQPVPTSTDFSPPPPSSTTCFS